MLSAFRNLFALLAPDDDAHVEFPTPLHFLHALARALEHGSSQPPRPALPLEIVIQILHYAECFQPGPPLTLATSDREMSVTCGSSELCSERYLVSQPLSRRDIYQIGRMVVSTRSRDQGWASDPGAGNYSWFDVSIVMPNGEVKTRPKSMPLVWASHHNNLASWEYANVEGEFEADHEIWEHLEEGDRIAVSAVAQYPGWANHVTAGSLRVWHWFEPTLPPR